MITLLIFGVLLSPRLDTIAREAPTQKIEGEIFSSQEVLIPVNAEFVTLVVEIDDADRVNPDNSLRMDVYIEDEKDKSGWRYSCGGEWTGGVDVGNPAISLYPKGDKTDGKKIKIKVTPLRGVMKLGWSVDLQPLEID